MSIRQVVGSNRIPAVLKGLLPAIITLCIFILGRQLVVKLFDSSSDELSGPQFLLFACLMGVLFLGMTLVGIYIAMAFEESSFSDFGQSVNTAWIRTFVTGVAITLLGVGISWWWGEYRGIRSLDLAAVGVRGPDNPLLVVTVLVVATGYFLFQNIYEEVIYRRIMIQNFAEGLTSRGISMAAAVGLATFSSLVLFGLLHIAYRGSVIVAVDAALTGTMFAFAYLLTGELALPIGIHFGRHITAVLRGQSYGVVDLVAVGEVTTNTLSANLEMRLIQIGVVCLLISLWVFFKRGSIGIPESIYQQQPHQSQTD